MRLATISACASKLGEMTGLANFDWFPLKGM